MKDVTAGAAKRFLSVLGPVLWNFIWWHSMDGHAWKYILSGLRLRYCSGYYSTSCRADSDQIKACYAISYWMTDYGLEVASAEYLDNAVQTKAVIKCLGILLDTKPTFWVQIKRAADKAATVTTALSRIMANTSGPKPSKRRLPMSVTHSVLLYGCLLYTSRCV